MTVRTTLSGFGSAAASPSVSSGSKSNEYHSSEPPRYSGTASPTSPSALRAETANAYSIRSETHVAVADGALAPAGGRLYLVSNQLRYAIAAWSAFGRSAAASFGVGGSFGEPPRTVALRAWYTRRPSGTRAAITPR